MIAPTSLAMAADFGITSSTVIALTITVFVLAYGKCCLAFENDPANL